MAVACRRRWSRLCACWRRKIGLHCRRGLLTAWQRTHSTSSSASRWRAGVVRLVAGCRTERELEGGGRRLSCPTKYCWVEREAERLRRGPCQPSLMGQRRRGGQSTTSASTNATNHRGPRDSGDCMLLAASGMALLGAWRMLPSVLDLDTVQMLAALPIGEMAFKVGAGVRTDDPEDR